MVADTRAAPSVDDEEGSNNNVLSGPTIEEERKEQRVLVDYDWTEEWYPLYLTKDVPEDAPLGLTVYNKQLVLYRDGFGELRCYEDRCPHR